MSKQRRVLRSSRVSPNPNHPKPDSKEWEEAKWPICMEPPHNATLLKCSLSRPTGYIVNDRARGFMNKNPRACACDGCEFVGNYGELRDHADSVHPRARPAEADPGIQDLHSLSSESGDDFTVNGRFDYVIGALPITASRTGSDTMGNPEIQTITLDDTRKSNIGLWRLYLIMILILISLLIKIK